MEYPKVTPAQLDSWRGLSYADLAFEVLSLYCPDIPKGDLRALVRKTYTAAVYSNGRSEDKASDITPLHWLGEESVIPAYWFFEFIEWPYLSIQRHGYAVVG